MRKPPRKPNYPTFGDLPLEDITLSHSEDLRDRGLERAGPEAANERVEVLKQLFEWAVREGHVQTNSAADLKRI